MCADAVLNVLLQIFQPINTGWPKKFLHLEVWWDFSDSIIENVLLILTVK